MSKSCPVNMYMAAARDTPTRVPGSVPGISPGTVPLTFAHLSHPSPCTKPTGWKRGSLLVGTRVAASLSPLLSFYTKNPRKSQTCFLQRSGYLERRVT